MNIIMILCDIMDIKRVYPISSPLLLGISLLNPIKNPIKCRKNPPSGCWMKSSRSSGSTSPDLPARAKSSKGPTHKGFPSRCGGLV